MPRAIKYVALVAVILLAGAWSVTHGQGYPPGSLDPTFGSGGVATMSLSTNLIERIAIQNLAGENLIIAAAKDAWTVARHRANGALDTRFGSGGVVTKTFKKGSASLAGGIVVDPGGNLIVAGSVPTGANAVSTFAVARYLPNGAPDQGFGTGGLAAIAASPDGITLSSKAEAIALQPDGKVVAVGRAATADGYSCMSVVRLLANGRPDPDFGQGGLFTYRHRPGMLTYGDSVVIQPVQGPSGPEDRIVVAVAANEQRSPSQYLSVALVMRLTEGGTLDGTFGQGAGFVRLAVPDAAETHLGAMAVDSANRIVAAGTAYYGTSANDMVVARFTDDGLPDSGFATGGLFTQRWSGLNSSVRAVGLQSDDNILVAGQLANGDIAAAAVWRFLPDGSLDQNFGSNHDGAVTYGSAQFWDLARVDGTNTFVTGGRTVVKQGKRFTGSWALWRYYY